MIIQPSSAAAFFLTTIKHAFAKTSSENGFIIRVIIGEPSDDRSDSCISMLLPLVVTIGDCSFGDGDVGRYLLGG